MKNSPAFVKQQFAQHGVSVHEWAAAHGFTPSLVYAVLAGKCKATRGQSHRIAVALGLQIVPVPEDAPTFLHRVLVQRKKGEETNMT